MNDEKSKKSNYLIYTPFVLVVVLIIGLFIGERISSHRNIIYTENITNYNKFDYLLSLIEENYVDTIQIDSLIENAIPYVLEKLDPHSVYITAEDLKKYDEPLEGNFDGIGIQFNTQNDTIVVINTISGGPSERVGLRAGDRIVSINDTVCAGVKMPTDNIVKRLKGLRGTKVKVDVKRMNIDKNISFVITRDKIPLYSLDVSYMIDKEIAYVKISRFAQTTHSEFIEAITKLRNKGMTKLILDLRGNGGGYLSAAIDIANEFLYAGKMIVYTAGRNRNRNEYRAKKQGICVSTELAILIDSWSASASEIVAGAIQDNDRGTIIGQRSFGKGLVQEPRYFSDGSAVRLTVARYYTPTGRSIQKPYSDNPDSYENELNERFKRGELEQSDSTHFNENLKFTTPAGKTVYGGGGIMPDIFVPRDTVGYSTFLRDITTKGLIFRYAFDYVDFNREKLSKLKSSSEINNYLENINIFNKFVEFAFKNGIKADTKSIQTSKHIVNTQLKANIARNIIDNEGFFPIIQEIDSELKKAIEVIKNQTTNIILSEN